MSVDRRPPLSTSIATLVVCLVIWFLPILIFDLWFIAPIALLFAMPVIVAALMITGRHGRGR